MNLSSWNNQQYSEDVLPLSSMETMQTIGEEKKVEQKQEYHSEDASNH